MNESSEKADMSSQEFMEKLVVAVQKKVSSVWSGKLKQLHEKNISLETEEHRDLIAKELSHDVGELCAVLMEKLPINIRESFSFDE